MRRRSPPTATRSHHDQAAIPLAIGVRPLTNARRSVTYLAGAGSVDDARLECAFDVSDPSGSTIVGALGRATLSTVDPLTRADATMIVRGGPPYGPQMRSNCSEIAISAISGHPEPPDREHARCTP